LIKNPNILTITESDAEFYLKQLNMRLIECKDDHAQVYAVHSSLFDAVSDFLGPLGKVLLILKEGLLKYGTYGKIVPEKDEKSKLKEKELQYKEIFQEIIKEKEMIMEQVRELLDDRQKNMRIINGLKQEVCILNRNFQGCSFNDLSYDQLSEQVKKCHIAIYEQGQMIKKLKINERKFKRILDILAEVGHCLNLIFDKDDISLIKTIKLDVHETDEGVLYS
jgi:hypothetical protein